jgi:predicted Zn-dependent protease
MRALFIAFLIFIFSVRPAAAEQVLRDTETENFLIEQTTPIFHAAGLAPASIHFVLIDDTTINAFVAGGQNIFIYSGLILRTENLDELLGVIAHETGHIVG